MGVNRAGFAITDNRIAEEAANRRLFVGTFVTVVNMPWDLQIKKLFSE